jgi:hypothetical protein
MVYFLAVFLFHSVATMPTVYWTEDACENAGKQMGVLYSCLGVLSVQASPRYPDQPDPGYVTADAPAHAAAEAQLYDDVDWEARRRFMHRTFKIIRERLPNTRGKPAD